LRSCAGADRVSRRSAASHVARAGTNTCGSWRFDAILLGMIGEYLARIYRQVKPGPLTTVDRFVDRAGSLSEHGQPHRLRAVAGIVLPGNQLDPGDHERRRT
jgi:hypothetical protein